MNKKHPSNKKAFTLIELMVSVSLFSMVMLFSMGAILSILDANRKAASLRSVMDNLNFTLESMTRTIRFGTNYHCSGSDIAVPGDCPGGSATLSVLDSTGHQITYSFANSQITRVIDGGTIAALTSADITIQSLTFRVFGSAPYNGGLDTYQPQVIVVVKGSVVGKGLTGSQFTLETTVTQRKLDLQ